jgi:hypothetical protein
VLDVMVVLTIVVDNSTEVIALSWVLPRIRSGGRWYCTQDAVITSTIPRVFVSTGHKLVYSKVVQGYPTEACECTGHNRRPVTKGDDTNYSARVLRVG